MNIFVIIVVIIFKFTEGTKISITQEDDMSYNNELERVSPESVGISSKVINKFIDTINDKKINLHSFMLLRHGKIAAEGYYKPFVKDYKHRIFSVSKSFTSAAVGIAIDEGLIGLNDRIVDFFPEKLCGNVHEYNGMMTVEHLLKMATSHEKSTSTEGVDWVKGFLNTEPSHRPGTIFAYDTTGTHTLCAILQKVTGMTVHEYLKNRLFGHIGIGEIEWESCPMNINKGGSGIKCTTEDMARFGQLYLQKGLWNGLRLITEKWVEQSTSKQIDNTNTSFMLDGKKGYGYKFWRCRNNSYCAFGMGGQFILVIPEKDAVFVTTANTNLHKDAHQSILDTFWETIYPDMEDTTSLGENEPASMELKEKLSTLMLLLPEGIEITKNARELSGKKYILDKNRLNFDYCEFEFSENTSKLCFTKIEKTFNMYFTFNDYFVAEDPVLGRKAANGGVWVDEKTLVIISQLFDIMEMFIITCHFDAETVVIQIQPGGELNGENLGCYLNGTSIK